MYLEHELVPNFKAGMWSFWIINIISLFAVGSYQGSQFSSEAGISETIDISGITSDTLQINVEADPHRRSTFMIGDVKVSDKRLISRHIHLNIVKSDSGVFELSQENYSRGMNESEASRLASSIKYDLRVEDNMLVFPRIMEFSKGEKWRNQYINLTLKVPEGKSIHLQKSIWSISHHVDIDRDQEYPHFDQNQTWIMGENGLINEKFIAKSRRSEEFKNKNFDHLQIDGSMNVTIKKGEQYKIEMSGKPDYLDEVELIQLDKTLNLNLKERHRHSKVRITVTMPELKTLDINDTRDISVQGFTQKTMRIKQSGRNELDILAKIDSIYLIQQGRCELVLKGDGTYLEAVLGRDSNLDAKRFRVKKAKIEAKAYSRNASVAVSDSLWIEREGGNRISVDGSPIVSDVQVEMDKH